MQIESRSTVVITGCSEGSLGAALALEFQKRGFCVFATVRSLSKAESLSQAGVELVHLDVTSNESVQRCAKHVQDKARGSLDVLINNAGAISAGPLLDVFVEESRKIYDVNVWGMVRMTQAFGRLLVNSKGAVLNISSMGGAIPLAWQDTHPGLRIYNSSKAAQSLLSETLRLELEPLGVRVITAMVGEVETKIYPNSQPLNLPKKSLYASIESYISHQAAGGFTTANEPAHTTAQNIVSDVLNGKSGLIWRGGSAGTARLITSLLPTRVRDWIVHSGRGLDKISSPAGKDLSSQDL